MFLNIRPCVPETLPQLSQKAGNFEAGRLKILRAGRLLPCWAGSLVVVFSQKFPEHLNFKQGDIKPSYSVI